MMKTFIDSRENLITFGIPILMLLVLSYLAASNLSLPNSQQFYFGVTFDFLITVPLVYFLLIRKTKISKSTVYLFIFGGLILASYSIPIERQIYLSLAKKWLVPVLESVILIIVLIKLTKGIIIFKNSGSYDFFNVIKNSCEEILPKKISYAFATEVAVFYYGFINWKNTKPKLKEFSYHKGSGIISTLIAVLFIISIETFVVHILISKWNETVAWILSVLGIYTAVQIFGFMKSISRRYISIENGILHLRYGILCETSVELKNIRSIELSSADIPKDSTIRKFSAFSNLESHNVIIRLEEEQIMIRPYGFKVKFKELALYIDNKEDFKLEIKNAL